MASPALTFVLHHERGRWVARGHGVTAYGTDLPRLDADLASRLAAAGQPGGPVRVFMGFDAQSLPVWTRQYAGHYFNRHLILRIRT